MAPMLFLMCERALFWRACSDAGILLRSALYPAFRIRVPPVKRVC